MKALIESLLDDQDKVMDQLDKKAIVAEFNNWIKGNFYNYRITADDIEYVDGRPVIRYESNVLKINSLPPFDMVLRDVYDIEVTVGLGKKLQWKEACEFLNKLIIQDSGGWMIDKLVIRNRQNTEKKIKLSDLGPLEFSKVDLDADSAAVEIPFSFCCKQLEIKTRSGVVYCTGLPNGTGYMSIKKIK